MTKWADTVLRATGKWVLLVFALVLALGARAEEPRYFAIRHARIVPVSGPAIKSGTVVIAKGLIVAVGENVSIPPEAWVIEGKGLTVYPGFINALSDLGLGPPTPARPGRRWRGPWQGSTAAAAVGLTGPQDRPASTPWINAADELKPDDKRLETWRNAGFTSTLAAPMTGIFPGQGAVVNLAGERPAKWWWPRPAPFLLPSNPCEASQTSPTR